jgi:hypothetical protein
MLSAEAKGWGLDNSWYHAHPLSILQIEPDTNLANQNVQGEIMSISYKNNNLIKVTTAKYIILVS